MNESAIHKMTTFARNVAILLKIVEIVVGQDSSPNKRVYLPVKLAHAHGKRRSVNSDKGTFVPFDARRLH